MFLCLALLRQTDPNWRAFFYITDLVPFESRLRKILKGYGDKRLKYLAVDSAFRPAVSPFPIVVYTEFLSHEYLAPLHFGNLRSSRARTQATPPPTT